VCGGGEKSGWREKKEGRGEKRRPSCFPLSWSQTNIETFTNEHGKCKCRQKLLPPRQLKGVNGGGGTAEATRIEAASEEKEKTHYS